jgi:hypothetical protein
MITSLLFLGEVIIYDKKLEKDDFLRKPGKSPIERIADMIYGSFHTKDVGTVNFRGLARAKGEYKLFDKALKSGNFLGLEFEWQECESNENDLMIQVRLKQEQKLEKKEKQKPPTGKYVPPFRRKKHV